MTTRNPLRFTVRSDCGRASADTDKPAERLPSGAGKNTSWGDVPLPPPVVPPSLPGPVTGRVVGLLTVKNTVLELSCHVPLLSRQVA
jgi:hypothetical protein